MTFLSRLDLSRFRCYAALRIADLPAGFIALTGPNGAGKTNILEAVSLLAPGRGLRGAEPGEIQARGITQAPAASPAPHGWAVSAELRTAFGPVQLGTGWDPATNRRLARIDGQPAKSRAATAEFLSVVWLTPQMDRLFLDSAGARRKFFDRLVFAFDPGHAGRVTRYENATAQRSKLLREGGAEPAWLDALENQMAETGTAIAAARVDFLHRLRQACDAAPPDAPFPRALPELRGQIEADLIGGRKALEVEDNFRRSLRAGRESDARTGGAGVGPHRSDLLVHHIEKNIEAALCSTGEQKALLIGLMLAHARLIRAERGEAPVLLLDEVAAHLDAYRRAALFEILGALGGQVWMTGTDTALFSALPHSALRLQVCEAQIFPGDPGEPLAQDRATMTGS